MFVLFDSCWDPVPEARAAARAQARRPQLRLGAESGPKALQDPSQYPRLEAYVKGVVGAFAKDERVLAWDIWNEPDNPNDIELRQDRTAEQGGAAC